MEGKPNKYPLVKFKYTVSFTGDYAPGEAGFSEVTGFDYNIDVVEYREGDFALLTPVKIPGLRKYGAITLKWGTVDATSKFYDWIVATGTTEKFRANLMITLNDFAGKPVVKWQVNNAWPSKYTAPDFNATASEVAIETLELTHEGMERVK